MSPELPTRFLKALRSPKRRLLIALPIALVTATIGWIVALMGAYVVPGVSFLAWLLIPAIFVVGDGLGGIGWLGSYGVQWAYVYLVLTVVNWASD